MNTTMIAITTISVTTRTRSRPTPAAPDNVVDSAAASVAIVASPRLNAARIVASRASGVRRPQQPDRHERVARRRDGRGGRDRRLRRR